MMMAMMITFDLSLLLFLVETVKEQGSYGEDDGKS
jgi:hypothetical protein